VQAVEVIAAQFFVINSFLQDMPSGLQDRARDRDGWGVSRPGAALSRDIKPPNIHFFGVPHPRLVPAGCGATIDCLWAFCCSAACLPIRHCRGISRSN